MGLWGGGATELSVLRQAVHLYFTVVVCSLWPVELSQLARGAFFPLEILMNISPI
jgi:hypothetical protein